MSASTTTPTSIPDSGHREPTAPKRRPLTGNRWALVGGIVYLLEWVAIIGSAALGLDGLLTEGATPETLAETYAGHVDTVALVAGWFAVVLLGRVLFFVALRHALVRSGFHHPLLDLAVPAAAVSVAFEISSYGLGTAAASLADTNPAGAATLEAAGVWLGWLLVGGLGLAIVCAAYAMLRSELFPTVLGILGLVGGAPVLAAQFFVAPGFRGVVDVLGNFVTLFWIWMLWVGVYLWLKTPRGGRQKSPVRRSIG